MLACSLSLSLFLLPVVVAVLHQLPFSVWRSVLLLFLLFRIAPGVLPFPCNYFRRRRRHVVEFDFLFSLIPLTISTLRSGLSHELASRVLCQKTTASISSSAPGGSHLLKSFVLNNSCINQSSEAGGSHLVEFCSHQRHQTCCMRFRAS